MRAALGIAIGFAVAQCVGDVLAVGAILTALCLWMAWSGYER